MENIQVCVRFRPNAESKSLVDQQFTILSDKKRISTSQKQQFEFDYVFDEQTNNLKIFNAMVSPFLPSFIQGQNLAIFTYGQTSSGKTHTMFGNSSEKGITELALIELFQLLEGKHYEVKISHLEIYNENIHDLLNPSNANLKLLSNKNKTIVLGLVSLKVLTAHEAIAVFKKSINLRVIGDNQQNNQSSRSHSIFQVHLNVRNGHGELNSELNLIDLAGSESLKNADKSSASWNEGKSINQSLLTLIKCMNELKKPNAFCAYRESLLTRVLQESLNKKSGLVFICTVSSQYTSETLSTLNFGISAKKVKLKPDINELINYEECKNPECEDLKEQLNNAYEEINELKEKLQERNEKIKEVPKTEEKIEVKDREVMSRLLNCEMENEFLKNENENLREDCRDLEIKLNHFKSHDFLQDDQENNSNVIISKLLSQNSSLKSSLDEVILKHNKILKENQSLLNIARKINNNDDEIFHGCTGACYKSLERAEQEKSELKAYLETLKHSLKLQSENSVSLEEHKSLQDHYHSCLKANENLSVKLKHQEKKLSNLESELRDLKQEESKTRTLECQIEKLQNEKENLKYRLELKDENFQLYKINTPSSKKFVEAFEVNSRIELELETLRSENCKLNISYQELLKQIQNKKKSLCEKCIDNDWNSSSLSDLKQKNEFMDAKIGKLKKEKEEILLQKTKCEEELERKSGRILNLIEENGKLTKKLEELRNGSEFSHRSSNLSPSYLSEDL